MSWLNLNDSLNSLKGQISNFANTVLAEEDEPKEESTSSEVAELQKICTQQQDKITSLQKLNEELSSQANGTMLCNNGQSNETWSWDVPNAQNSDKNQQIITDLKKTISELQKEKKELMVNLDLLDRESLLNAEKLNEMRNELQQEYNALDEKYTRVKDENEHLKQKLRKTNQKSPTVNQPHEKTCTKCETLHEENHKYQQQVENFQKEIGNLKNSQATLQKILDDNKISSELEEKLKLQESENKILVSELKKANQLIVQYEKKSAIDADNCKKLAHILEGYEQQVGGLKEELLQSANSKTEELQQEIEKLKAEKEYQHFKYVNILTESVKRYVESDSNGEKINDENEEDPQITEFSHQVESILNILLDLKNKCESLEKDLYSVTQEKTKILTEKNHEIEKLIQNSEILSQEVITKSQTIKDYEGECGELIKNNDMLINELNIFKNNSGLQTISESNEDNLLLLEAQLENANKRIEELEQIITKKETEEIDEKLLEDYNKLKDENSALAEELENLKSDNEVSIREKEDLLTNFEKMKSDFENTEYQYTEINVNMESLKEEVDHKEIKIKELFEVNQHLEKNMLLLERSNEDIRSELNTAREKLLFEEDTRKQYESQIRNLTEKLQNAKMNETSLKLQYDTISKEITSISEAKTSIELSLKNTLAILNNERENLNTLREENEHLTNMVEELKIEKPKLENVNLENEQELKMLQQDNERLKGEISELASKLDAHSTCIDQITILEKKLEEVEATKTELTNVIITKHQESVTYHNEITRLTQILNAEVEKNRILEAQLQSPKVDSEIEKLTDQNNFLKEKCEVMAQNLLEEQSKVQKILSEYAEKELNLNKKLERLQTHLIEVEEHYTQELLKAEEKNSELQQKVSEIEQREKDSSTMYTSVSIRANQHVETLQHQLQLITNQRDELRKKISDAEDYASKQEAALANLQFVLEQFQKDKEKGVQMETERLRRQISMEKQVQEELRKEILALQVQLEESKNGLLAASRLSDQLEQSKQLITSLKSEVSQLKDSLQKSQGKLDSMSNQSDGKVDKSLIKNLVIGLVSTNNNLNKDQMQILKIIATVLDFNKQDHDKVNLNRPQQGWLSSLLAPQTSQGMTQESLSQAFVKFLENESKPRSVPSLLNNGDVPSRKNSTATSSRHSPSALSEVVLPTFADFAQNRNSSSILKDVLKDNS